MFFGRLSTAPLGMLRTRATLLSPIDQPDEIGGAARSFVPVATLWCRLEPVLGDERFVVGRIEEAVSHRIEMRWRADVTAAMRLAVGSRAFVITATGDPDGRRRRLLVLADEIKI